MACFVVASESNFGVNSTPARVLKTLISSHTHTHSRSQDARGLACDALHPMCWPPAREWICNSIFQCGLSVGSGYDVGFCGSCNMEDAGSVFRCCCYSLFESKPFLPPTIATLFHPTSFSCATNPRYWPVEKACKNYVYALLCRTAAVFHTLCLMCVLTASNCACQRQQRAIEWTAEKQSLADVGARKKPALDLFDISATSYTARVLVFSPFVEITFKLAHVRCHWHAEFE